MDHHSADDLPVQQTHVATQDQAVDMFGRLASVPRGPVLCQGTFPRRDRRGQVQTVIGLIIIQATYLVTSQKMNLGRDCLACTCLGEQ